MTGDSDLRNDIATAARAFSRLGYVHAFGHVSARLEESLLITPTRPPLAAQTAADVLEVDFTGAVVSGTLRYGRSRFSAHRHLSGARRCPASCPGPTLPRLALARKCSSPARPARVWWHRRRRRHVRSVRLSAHFRSRHKRSEKSGQSARACLAGNGVLTVGRPWMSLLRARGA